MGMEKVILRRISERVEGGKRIFREADIAVLGHPCTVFCEKRSGEVIDHGLDESGEHIARFKQDLDGIIARLRNEGGDVRIQPHARRALGGVDDGFSVLRVGGDSLGQQYFFLRIALRHDDDKGVLRTERFGDVRVFYVDVRVGVFGSIDDITVLQVGLDRAPRNDQRDEHEGNDESGRKLKIGERAYLFLRLSALVGACFFILRGAFGALSGGTLLDCGIDRFVLALFDQAGEQQHECGHEEEHAQKGNDDALCKYHADVKPDGELHEHERDQSRDRRQVACGNRREGLGERGADGLPRLQPLLPFFVETMQKNDGIVHGKGELHDGADGLRNEGYFSQKEVGPQIDDQRPCHDDGENQHVRPGVGSEQQDAEHDGEGDDEDDDHVPRNARAQVLRLHRSAVHGNRIFLQGGAYILDDGVRFNFVIPRFEKYLIECGIVLIRGGIVCVEDDGAHAGDGHDRLHDLLCLFLGHVFDHELCGPDAAELFLHFIQGHDGRRVFVEIFGHIVIGIHKGDHECAHEDQHDIDSRERISVFYDEIG